MSLLSTPGRVSQRTCHEALRFEQVASLRRKILVREFYMYPGLPSHRAEVASNLFTVFHADTSHGRRFLQVLHGQFLCFALIFPRSPQTSCSFDPIYYSLHRPMSLRTKRTDATASAATVTASTPSVSRSGRPCSSGVP